MTLTPVPLGSLYFLMTYSTTPPLNPNDGDLWIWPPPGATQGEEWVMRYNARSASGYKWEFVGGPPILIFAAGSATVTTVGTWGDLSDGPNPVWTPGISGVYRCRGSARFSHSVVNAPAFVGVGTTTGASPVRSGEWNGMPATLPSDIVAPLMDVNIAGTTVGVKNMYLNNLAGTLTGSNRMLEIVPVRVNTVVA